MQVCVFTVFQASLRPIRSSSNKHILKAHANRLTIHIQAEKKGASKTPEEAQTSSRSTQAKERRRREGGFRDRNQFHSCILRSSLHPRTHTTTLSFINEGWKKKKSYYETRGVVLRDGRGKRGTSDTGKGMKAKHERKSVRKRKLERNRTGRERKTRATKSSVLFLFFFLHKTA